MPRHDSTWHPYYRIDHIQLVPKSDCPPHCRRRPFYDQYVLWSYMM